MRRYALITWEDSALQEQESGVLRLPFTQAEPSPLPPGRRYALPAPRRYAGLGRSRSAALDGGVAQNTWGRLFVDATLPSGTELRVACFSSDQRDAEMREERLIFTPLVARRSAELSWVHRAAGDEVQTLEGYVLADPGRFLWVVLELRGRGRSTPRVRAARVELSGHDYLGRLPRVFAREASAAAGEALQPPFLQRYLALMAGFLGELEERAEQRHVLLNPRAAPAELLPWLASLLGLELDEKWSERQRRRLLGAWSELLRLRGTVAGLQRLLEIFTEGPVRVLEHHQLRGGSALLGDERGSVVGAGLQLGPGDPGTDPCAPTAHRCTVVVLARLGDEAQRAVAELCRAHAPAHVVCDLCLATDGMRVGRGLRVGFTTRVGRDSGWRELEVGEILGGEALLAAPSEQSLTKKEG